MHQWRTDRVAEAIASIATTISISENRPRRPIEERELWRVLSVCLLSSQVPYEVALSAATRIDHARILWSKTCSRDRELRLRILLEEPIRTEKGCRRYRFPSLKARQLAASKEVVTTNWGTLQDMIELGGSPSVIRRFLVETLPGIGPKQASMFLRDARITGDVAILDTHVLRYMRIVGLHADLKAGLSSYEECERVFSDHAHSLGLTAGTADTAVWVVMRAAREIGWA